MFNVRVNFQGLCVFVPGENLGKNPNPKWVGVFMVGANERARENFGIDLEPHYSFVKFKLNDLRGAESAPEDTCFWQLHDEDVVFLTGNDPGVLEVKLAPVPLGATPQPPRDPEQESFFDWVPKIEEKMPGAGTLRSECFRNEPGGRINSRFHITEGTLVTAALGEYQGDYVLSQFDPGPNGGAPASPPRAHARIVALDVSNIKGPFVLRSRRFKPGDEKGVVRELVFRDPGEGKLLEISVVNLCPLDLPEDVTRRPKYPRPDVDFGWFYVLSLIDPDIPKPVPIPVQFSLGGVGGGEPAQCTGCSAKPPSAAIVSFMLNQVDEIKKAQ